MSPSGPIAGALSEPASRPFSSRVGLIKALAGTIATIGDSRDVFSTDGATARQKGGTDAVNVACGLAFQKYKAVGIPGLSGKRVDEYLSSGQATVVSLAPGVVYVPSVLNSIGQDYPSQSTSGISAAVAMIAAIQAWRAAGSLVIIGSEIGQVSIADVRRDQCDIYNNAMREYAASHSGVYFYDRRATLCDANRKLLTGFSYDGTHLNGLGGQTDGALLKVLLDKIMPTANDYQLQANGLPLDNANLVQLMPNPLFNTTTGGSTSTGATGTFAGSCTFNKTGASAALAVSSAAQNVVLTGTFGAQSDNVRMSQTVPIGNWSSGMKVRGMALINVASPVNLAGVTLSMVANGDSVSTTYADMISTATWAGPDAGFDMLMLTQEYTIPAYSSKGFLSSTVQANAFGAGGVVLTVKQLGIQQNTA